LANQHIIDRLEGIQKMLMGAHKAGSQMSNASRGSEREAFINAFLCEVLPPQFRFGSGDITDQSMKRSGQLDIVIEFPFVPSLPIVTGKSPRLYLAEGVLAVVEVKSDIRKQWKEVERTADSLSKIKRNYGTGFTFGVAAGSRIPLYAVSYEGWKDFAMVERHLDENPSVSGILIIQHGHFSGVYKYEEKDQQGKPMEKEFSRQSKSSAMALWELISCLHFGGSMMTSTTKYVPSGYNQKDV
jgi:hypothetical protein